MPNITRECSAGAAVADITPPLGCRLAGYFHERRASGVLDPLEMGVLLIRGPEHSIAVVALDLIALEQKDCWLIGEAVSRASGIPPANVLVTCSHTHTGPETVDLLGSPAELAYLQSLPAAAERAAREALERTVPVSLFVGRTSTDGIAFNRRYLLKDGTVRTNPGIGNPDVVRPVGPVDPELSVLAFRGHDGSLAAVAVCFALHADTTGGTMISADHPGHMRRALAERLGVRTPVLFLQGFCGDVNHIDVNGEAAQQGFEHSRRIGERIADAACKALDAAEEVPCAPIRTARELVPMPLRTPTDEQLRAAQLLLSGDSSAWDAAMDPAIPESWRPVYAQEILSLAAAGRTHIDAPVWAAGLGPDAAIVGMPGEMFAEFALRLKEGSPFSNTLPVELAGGYVGYVPTAQAFREGGYETWLAGSSMAAESAGDILCSRAEELLRMLAEA